VFSPATKTHLYTHTCIHWARQGAQKAPGLRAGAEGRGAMRSSDAELTAVHPGACGLVVWDLGWLA
jgi:hypothetical protein